MRGVVTTTPFSSIIAFRFSLGCCIWVSARCLLWWFSSVSYRLSVSRREAIRERERSRIQFSTGISGYVCWENGGSVNRSGGVCRSGYGVIGERIVDWIHWENHS